MNYLADSGLVDGLLGGTFNYPQYERLEDAGDNNVNFISSQNTVEFFEWDDGVYLSNNNTAAILRHVDDEDEFQLIHSGGAITRFHDFTNPSLGGLLKSKTDRFGNTVTYDWLASGGVGLLQTVTDGYGRQIVYRYCTPGESSSSSSPGAIGTRICEIEDFLGRKLNFQYDADGRLIAVVLPSIMRAAEGNEFPGGTAYVFRYASGLSSSSSSSGSDPDDLVNIWYPNQVMPYLNTVTREVDMEALYAAADAGSAAPRYTVEYDDQRRVIAETIGDPENGVGGTYTFAYNDSPSKTNLIDSSPAGDIVSETIMTDRNGNQVAYYFNAAEMVVCEEARTNRDKIVVTGVTGTDYITWTKYNAQNQVVERVFPEGNSVINEYDDGMVNLGSGPELYVRRRGLLLKKTRLPGNTNDINDPSRSGSGPAGEVQDELTTRYFYDPIYNRVCATIEERGNPIDTGLYFTPQNGGTTPTDADRSRYATITFYDYQKNASATITSDEDLQRLLFPDDDSGTAATKIQALITHVDTQMKASDGTGGIPAGFQVNLGDINGDGTGDGNSSGLDPAPMVGNVVKVQHPSVRLLTENTSGDPWDWDTQERVELFTVNARGQVTTHTDPEGNVTVNVRYPYTDPEGDGKFIADVSDVSPDLTGKQYGRMREIHVDADPNDVMSLIGADGDLADFDTDVFPRNNRTNTPGVYQNLTTRYEGGMAAGGCSSCAYDPLGNPLAMTDPRGFTSIMQRNEMGEVYRTTSSRPYQYQIEIHYDANRNVIRRDRQDVGVQFDSSDPANSGYAHFTPQIDENAPNVAQVPTIAGLGGEIRPGWFTNLYQFDLLNNLVEEDIDATGSTPSSLVTSYVYDANQNLIQITKPEGNLVRYDYDERNLRIAEAIGEDCDFDSSSSSSSGNTSCAITVYFYDRNGNLKDVIGPARRGTTDNELTATIEDAFGTGSQLTHTGDWLLENTYDGFDRVIASTDAVGNVASSIHAPGGRVIQANQRGPAQGPSPVDRNGYKNVDLAVSLARFDEGGRRYESQQNIFLVVASDEADPPVVNGGEVTNQILPSTRSVTHTGGGLATNSTTNSHSGTATLTGDPGDDSYVLSRTVHDAAGRVIIQALDNASLGHMTYDGANRMLSATDALGNTVENTYDGNSNVIHVTRTEKCTITEPEVTDEVFESAMYYDCLNRLVVSSGQGANGTLSSDPEDTDTLFIFSGYDSRGNTVVTIDPKKNTVITVYDGASRPTESHQHLRVLGEGDNPPEANHTFLPASAGTIRTITIYDGNSRVKQLVDDRGAPTNYIYDVLDRPIKMIFQDGSTRLSAYNAASDVVQYTDENGSVFANTYDPLGRRTACAITPASGVTGTSAQTFQYDGLSRMTYARDSVSLTHADVVTVYDSLSRMLEEEQTFGGNDRQATNSAFTSYPASEFTFPDDRQISNTFDALYRRTHVEEGSEESSASLVIAAWEFFGPGRVAEIQLGNGLICSYMNNARTHSAVQATVSNPSWGDDESDRLGYDGSGRMITKRYLIGGIDGETGAYNNTASVVGFTTAFDKASNKLYERHLHAETRSHQYQPRNQDTGAINSLGYDSVDRLRQYQRGQMNNGSGGGQGDVPGAQITTPISLPNAKTQQTYQLDGLGNWRNTTFTPVNGTEETQVRDHNYLNQITRIRADYADRVMELSPLGYWRLGEKSGATTAVDQAGDNDGSYEGDPELGESGALVSSHNTAVAFDAAGKYVDIGDVSDLSFEKDDSFTAGGWFKTVVSTDQAIIAKQANGSPSRGWFVGIQSGKLAFELTSTTGTNSIVVQSTAASPADGAWHMLLVTYDGSESASGVRIYLDGAEVATSTVTDNLSATTVTTTGARIASRGSNGTPFSGTLDEVVVLTGALSSVDIADLYQRATVDEDFDYDGTPGASNGNLANDGERGYLYDAFNRLVQVTKDPNGTPATIGTYTYDALGRRIRKVITNGGLTGTIPNGTTDCLYSGWRCIEERNPLGGGGSDDTPTKQMVWGIYLDELIQQKNLVTLNNFDADDELYPLQDLLYRTAGLADDTGVVREAYDCDAYGNTLVFRNAGSPPAVIDFDDADTQVDYPTCEFIFTGQRWDGESVIYYYKARFYVPQLGKFGQRDPRFNLSLHEYCGGSPVSFVDSFGEQHGGRGVSPGRSIPIKKKEPCSEKRQRREDFIRTITASGKGVGNCSSAPPECCELITVIIDLPDACADGFTGKGMGGHAGVGVGAKFYDYGPKAGEAASGLDIVPGGPYWSLHHPDLAIAIGYAQGLASAAPPDKKVDLLKGEICVKKSQAAKTEKYWIDKHKKPGLFWAPTHQCTTTAQNSLNCGGIYNPLFKGITPIDLAKELPTIKHSCGSNKGQGIKVVSI